jgi:hypothetical protein
MDAFYNSAMIKDQSYYKYKGWQQPDEKKTITHSLVIDEPERFSGMKQHTLDPRYLLASPVGDSIHNRLMFIYNNANNFKAVECYIKREGDLVTFQVSSEDGTITEKNVYDLSKAGVMIEYYNKTPTAEITNNYTYEEKSGVWILKSFKKKNINNRKSGSIIRVTRTIDWSNSVINVPFKEDEFTVEKLGLKHGDRVSDLRIDKGYIYEGTLLEPPPSPKTLIE